MAQRPEPVSSTLSMRDGAAIAIGDDLALIRCACGIVLADADALMYKPVTSSATCMDCGASARRVA